MSSSTIGAHTAGGGERRPVRIANCSGFFGDRLCAAKEMVDGGPIDVLTGDWLAELTMLILARQRMKNGPGTGWARTFVMQMEQVLGTCLDKGIKVVSNAGGLDPAGAAAALREKADAAGLGHVKIAYVVGDDLMPSIETLRESGEELINLDTGEKLADVGFHPLTANAYLGARGITEALAAGADVVITGRVTDAALAIGPAAWWHDWSYDEALVGDQASLDALAGALVAGHVIECGAQATGGNYSFFQDVPDLSHPGFPLAQIAADGSSIITKHEGTGGLVSVGTVTAQLLYEVGGPQYLNPDVTARFDSISLTQEGPDRVLISGVVGEVPPDRLKVAINTVGGFRNNATLVLTGIDIDAKADLVLRTLTGLTLDQLRATGNKPIQLAELSTLDVRELDVQLLTFDTTDPATLFEAQSFLKITVKDSDPKKVGRAFTSPMIEAALSSYPGMFATAPPGEGAPFGVYWPSTVAPEAVTVTVHLDEAEPFEVSPGGSKVDAQLATSEQKSPASPATTTAGQGTGIQASAQSRTVPLGRLVGARSGDKGGGANVGFWIPETDDDLAQRRYDWFAGWLTVGRVRELLPEAKELEVKVYPLPNLLAVNVVINGLLGRGVAESTRLDPQAKGLGEQFRARLVEVPANLAPEASA